MRKALLLAGILFLNTSVLLAQDRSSEKPKVKGTYQIEVHNIRAYPYVPHNIEELVQKNRKKTEVSYLRLSPYVRVKIWPESEINAAGYMPPENEVVHYFGVL